MKRPLLFAPLCAGLLGLAPPAGAQQFHDAMAGPSVSFSSIAGGAFAPLAALAAQPGQAAGVAAALSQTAVAMAAAGICVTERLGARALTSAISGAPIPAATQALMHGILNGTRPASELASALAAGGAEEAATALAEAMVGLAAVPDVALVAAAIGHFNALIAASSEEFLAAPPPELLAVHAALAQVGLRAPCSPLPRVEVCVATPGNMLTQVQGIVQPATGDTLLDGRPFRELHSSDQPQYAAGHDWFIRETPITFQGRSYAKSGARRLIAREGLLRLGEYRGVAIFAESGTVPPYYDLYLPAGPGCDFQAYVATTSGERRVEVCAVLPTGEIIPVEAAFRPLTGDTVVDGRPLRELHHAGQPQYAAGHDWFVDDLPITLGAVEHVKFGVRRVIRAGELRRVGEYRGVPLFTAIRSSAPVPELYAPVGPGCEFQPYLQRDAIRVRG